MDGQYLYLATLVAMGTGLAIYSRYNHRKSKARYIKLKKAKEIDALVSDPRDQSLTPEKKALYDAIKEKAAELEVLYENLPDSRYKAVALNDLEASVMWIIKELTALRESTGRLAPERCAF
ncbi:MAG: hypothetical protein WDN02_02740 [Methylovirgula sp.]|uniref:Acb2/Tad1 domain-containing protein n=1 Tax=Methylovirgula sp. TaxID=1978224 RepID=UPI0030761055